MKTIQIISFAFFLCSLNIVNAQVAINTDNSAADASAMLDVKSTAKGVLVPRLTSSDRTMISGPAVGLLVFDTDTESFWFYKSAGWVELNDDREDSIEDADGDTKIQVEEGMDDDTIRFDVSGTEVLRISKNAGDQSLFETPNDSTSSTFFGDEAGLNTLSSGVDNSFFGHSSGKTNTTGFRNSFFGESAGNLNTTASFNSFFGDQAGYFNTTGEHNSFFGQNAGNRNTTANNNSFFGQSAGYFNTTGASNSFFGQNAGFKNTTGFNNTYIGSLAGLNNTTGVGNVAIGGSAAYNETGSHKLYIENSSSSSPLIYGEFDNDLVRINGTLNLNNAFSFPLVDGTADQVLKTDGSGSLTWDNIASSEIKDMDGDTQIQVEESPNEDIIRFDLAGTEILKVSQNAHGQTLFETPNNSSSSTFFGDQAGLNNLAIGLKNSFFGNSSGFSNDTGDYNSFYGYQSGYFNTIGEENSFFGRSSGIYNTIGEENSFFGSLSGTHNTEGNNNSFFGQRAGYSNVTGSGNVAIGYRAAYNETGSNKLYIENSDSASPLIYGEFDNDLVRINGTLNVNNAFSFPIIDGTANQVLKTDGSGSLSWNNISLPTLEDGDGDTNIQVDEDNIDDDIIRFDVEGTEVFRISKNGDGQGIFEVRSNYSGSTFFGYNAGFNNLTDGRDNSFFGEGSGEANTVGESNSFFGYWSGHNNTLGEKNSFFGNRAGKDNTEGTNNSFFGNEAGSKNTIGVNNSFFGNEAGNSNDIGENNSFFGNEAGNNNTEGNDNSFFGNEAGRSNTTGIENSFFGEGAGSSNMTGSGNVAIGYRAAFWETGSDKLYIHNSSSSTPLIYGEFNNDIVKINGALHVEDKIQAIDATGLTFRTDGGNTIIKIYDNGDFKLGSGGSPLTEVIKATVDQDVPSVPGNDRLDVTFNVPGAEVGSSVIVSPGADMPGLVFLGQARVSSANTVTVRFFNQNSNSKDPDDMSYFITIIR